MATFELKLRLVLFLFFFSTLTPFGYAGDASPDFDLTAFEKRNQDLMQVYISGIVQLQKDCDLQGTPPSFSDLKKNWKHCSEKNKKKRFENILKTMNQTCRRLGRQALFPPRVIDLMISPLLEKNDDMRAIEVVESRFNFAYEQFLPLLLSMKLSGKSVLFFDYGFFNEFWKCVRRSQVKPNERARVYSHLLRYVMNSKWIHENLAAIYPNSIQPSSMEIKKMVLMHAPISGTAKTFFWLRIFFKSGIFKDMGLLVGQIKEKQVREMRVLAASGAGPQIGFFQNIEKGIALLAVEPVQGLTWQALEKQASFEILSSAIKAWTELAFKLPMHVDDIQSRTNIIFKEEVRPVIVDHSPALRPFMGADGGWIEHAYWMLRGFLKSHRQDENEKNISYFFQDLSELWKKYFKKAEYCYLVHQALQDSNRGQLHDPIDRLWSHFLTSEAAAYCYT